jgi:DNA-binding response OmpR family regulator
MDVQDARVLLLEDDALISIDAEDMLLALGARAVFVAHSLADAAAMLDREVIDIAVLDIRIGNGRSDTLAQDIRARDIPFIFTSGYGSESGLPDGLGNVPTVAKPYTPDALLVAFRALGA